MISLIDYLMENFEEKSKENSLILVKYMKLLIFKIIFYIKIKGMWWWWWWWVVGGGGSKKVVTSIRSQLSRRPGFLCPMTRHSIEEYQFGEEEFH